MIPSPERLQETQLGALGVPSIGLIYSYNATNVRKCDDSYDRVVHTNETTNASSWLIHFVILCHTTSYHVTYDVTTPRPPVWPHSYVSVDHMLSGWYCRCHLKPDHLILAIFCVYAVKLKGGCWAHAAPKVHKVWKKPFPKWRKSTYKPRGPI